MLHMYRFSEVHPRKMDALVDAWVAAIKLARLTLVLPGSDVNEETFLSLADERAEAGAEVLIDALQDVAGLAASSEVWGLPTEAWSEPELMVAKEAAATARRLSRIMSEPVPDHQTSRVPRYRLVVLEFMVACRLWLGSTAVATNLAAKAEGGLDETIQ